MIPFINIGGDCFRSCMLGCIVKYILTLSFHGRPSFTAEYGVKVVHDINMHYLFLTFIMLMMSKPNFLVLFPLVTPDIYMLAGEMSIETPNIARSLSGPFKTISKLFYGTDNYALLKQQILDFNCMAEIGLGIIHIFEIFTPNRNVVGTVILWQFIRTRYMLMSDMKLAFTKLNNSVTGYIGKIPIISGCWRMIVKFASWMSQIPKPGDKPKGMASRCSVM